MRLVKIIITEKDFDIIKDQLEFHELREVIIKDNFFEGDETHATLKKASTKAYKQLKEYEFNKRYKC